MIADLMDAARRERGSADAHGGTLTVTSPPGEGATFRLALPIAAA
jgi:signal transduction histidine kinase